MEQTQKAACFNVFSMKNTSTGLAGGCHFTGIALCSSLTRQTRKYDLPTA